MLPQQYCLRWKYHHSNLQTMFSQLLDRGCFCDVTLACEGQLIRAHRVVLCACSTFFDSVLTNYASERDPIIIMRDVTFADIKSLIEFMYKGEINVEHANLASLLKTADDLKIKGLAEVTWRDDDDQPPPPPTPQTEFLSPTLQRASTNVYDYVDYAAGNVGGGRPDNQQHHQSQKTRTRTPEGLESNRHKTTYSPKQQCVSQTPPRIPSLPVVPTSTVSAVTAASSQNDAYMGQKRKRGRPPLDDSYDVFNVKKLPHGEVNANNTPVTLADNPQYNENMRELALESGDSSPRRTAVAAYQQHIYKLRARPKSLHLESEWINTNLETSANQPKIHDLDEDERLEAERQNWKITNNVEEDPRNRKQEYRTPEKTPEQQKMKISKRKSLKGDTNTSLEIKNDVFKKEEKSENTKDYAEKVESGKATHVKDADVIKEEHVSDGENTSKMKKPNSSPSSNVSSSSSSSSSDTAIHTGTKKSNHSMSAAVQLAHTYSTYCPEGYMINEHGMLMTHDFAHPPIPDIPTSSAAAANGHSTEEYADIKMEEFNESELRLTSEEMSQWQDVIKMDDYLAKGRRPQFWEEPFTRRVLDAIKGKRLEMKKAARILGVSYGTLYGRYRETYGCLKHPYNSTSMRNSQGSALSVPSRFDIVWPSAKPGQLDIGKLRPKDLSELWTRPQI